jgi:hypothetical protein
MRAGLLIRIISWIGVVRFNGIMGPFRGIDIISNLSGFAAFASSDIGKAVCLEKISAKATPSQMKSYHRSRD